MPSALLLLRLILLLLLLWSVISITGPGIATAPFPRPGRLHLVVCGPFRFRRLVVYLAHPLHVDPLRAGGIAALAYIPNVQHVAAGATRVFAIFSPAHGKRHSLGES